MSWKCALTSHSAVLNLAGLWVVSVLKSSTGQGYGDEFFAAPVDAKTASDDEIKARLRLFGVHYNLSSIMNILNQPEYKEDETMSVLLAKYEEIRQNAPLVLPDPLVRHPIISIDGFFTHGRTKIAKNVAKALYGQRLLLPTRHVTRLRSYFKSSLARKHYYSLSKYMGAHLAMTYCKTSPVILERYWHDQAAYVISKSIDGLVAENSSIYEFPKDLLVPDMMFFVNGALNPKIHNESTAFIHQHNELALKISEVFRRMKNPKLIEIGPPGLPAPLARSIIRIVKKSQHNFLPKPLYRPIFQE